MTRECQHYDPLQPGRGRPLEWGRAIDYQADLLQFSCIEGGQKRVTGARVIEKNGGYALI